MKEKFKNVQYAKKEYFKSLKRFYLKKIYIKNGY